MEKTKYYNIIEDFIIEQFLFGSKEDLQRDFSLLEQGIIDSMGVLEIATYLEDTFNIIILDDEVIPENLDTIDNICRFLETKVKCAG